VERREEVIRALSNMKMPIPAKAGIHVSIVADADKWIPAYAGMGTLNRLIPTASCAAVA
jgi:hypothetical protein